MTLLQITAPVNGDPPDPAWARQVTAAVNRMTQRIAALQHVGEVVAYDRQTTSSSTFTAETQIGSVTAILISGWTYLVKAYAQVSDSTEGERIQATLRQDTVAGSEMISARCDSRTSNQGAPNIIPLRALYVATATGEKAFVLSASRHSGSGNIKRNADPTFPQWMTVRLVSKT